MSRRVSILAACLATLIASAVAARAAEPRAEALAAASRIDDEVKRGLAKCWHPPAGIGSYTITVRFQLNRDGSVKGEPVAWEVKPTGTPEAAVQAAIATVRNCTPISLPAHAYDYWRQVQVHFVMPKLERPFGLLNQWF